MGTVTGSVVAWPHKRNGGKAERVRIWAEQRSGRPNVLKLFTLGGGSDQKIISVGRARVILPPSNVLTDQDSGSGLGKVLCVCVLTSVLKSNL